MEKGNAGKASAALNGRAKKIVDELLLLSPGDWTAAKYSGDYVQFPTALSLDQADIKLTHAYLCRELSGDRTEPICRLRRNLFACRQRFLDDSLKARRKTARRRCATFETPNLQALGMRKFPIYTLLPGTATPVKRKLVSDANKILKACCRQEEVATDERRERNRDQIWASAMAEVELEREQFNKRMEDLRGLLRLVVTDPRPDWLTEDEARLIRARVLEGKSFRAIASEFGYRNQMAPVRIFRQAQKTFAKWLKGGFGLGHRLQKELAEHADQGSMDREGKRESADDVFGLREERAERQEYMWDDDDGADKRGLD